MSQIMTPPRAGAALRARIAAQLAPAIALVLALAIGAPGCGGSSQAKGQSATPTAVEQSSAAAADGRARTLPRSVPELDFPDEPFRAEQPEAGEPRPFQLPPVKRFRLKNGIQVYLIEQHDLPLVSIDLNFDGGARADPPGKEGLASVCMDMLVEGTEELDKLAFKEALADTGSWVKSYTYHDSQGLTMGTLSKHLDATFALYRDALLAPGMRAEDLERMIQRRLESLKQTKASPRSVAWRVSGPVLYGPAHHRGRVTTEAAYQAITIDDCKAYHQRFIKPRGARLFVVGDMTEKQVRAQLGESLAAWRGRPPRLSRSPRPRPLDGKIFFVTIPGAAQSTVTVTHFGPGRKARDYMANQMMAAVLGGGFAGRINMNLREDKGYSYGAYGGFRYTREGGVFAMSSSVRSDSTYQTVLEMIEEMKALASGERPATRGELAREKNGAILGLPGRFATAKQALGQYRRLVYFGLPLDYYNTYVARVGKVSLAEVARSAKKHLKPDRARIIVVGDGTAPVIHQVNGKDEPLMKDGKPVTLLDALRELVAGGALGKGELVLLDADGNVLSK